MGVGIYKLHDQVMLVSPPQARGAPRFRREEPRVSFFLSLRSLRVLGVCGGAFGAIFSAASHSLGLSQLRPVRNLLQKSRQHWPPFFAHRSRQDHPLRLQAEYLSRLEVCDDDHFAPDQFLRLVILRDAGQYLARLGLAQVDCESQQFVGFRYAFSGQNLAYAQFDFRKIVDRDVGRRRRRLAHGLRRLSRRLNGLFFALFCSSGPRPSACFARSQGLASEMNLSTRSMADHAASSARLKLYSSNSRSN